MKGHRETAGTIFVLAVLGFLAYSNSFSVPFHFDDQRVIRFNFSLRDLGDWKNIISSEPFRPLLIATFALNYKIGKADPFSYHVLNLTGHFLAVVLFYFLLKRNSGHRWIPFGAACLMAVHPLNSEAITYISSRGIVYCAIFYFAALLSVDSYLRTKRKRFIPLFILFFVCGFLSKEDGALIPLAALLYNFLIFGVDSVKQHRRFHILTVGFVLLGAGLRIFFHFKFTAQHPHTFLTWILTEITVWLKYLWLAIYPVRLNVDPDVPVIGFSSPLLWVSITAIGALIYLFLRVRRTHAWFSFWGIWFFLNLLASSSVIPLVDFMAEHRVYISMFGFCACLSYMAFRLLADNIKNQRSAPLMVMLLVAFYGIATFQRNRVWQSEVSLWYDSMLKSPGKIRPRLNLAGSYFNKRAYDLAIQEYLHVMDLNPGIPECHSGLGISYLRKGEFELAEESFQRALNLKPQLIDPKTGLGMIRFRQGRWEDALLYFQQVYSFRRESLQLAYLMSEAYMRLGQYSEAIPILQQAIALHPSRADLQQMLEQAQTAASAKGDHK